MQNGTVLILNDKEMKNEHSAASIVLMLAEQLEENLPDVIMHVSDTGEAHILRNRFCDAIAEKPEALRLYKTIVMYNGGPFYRAFIHGSTNVLGENVAAIVEGELHLKGTCEWCDDLRHRIKSRTVSLD